MQAGMTKSLLWAAAGTLVFCDKIIFVSLNYGFFLEKSVKEGNPLKVVILSLLARLQ